MNPVLLEFLSSVARFALAAAFGVLVKHGIIEQGAVGHYVDAFSNWIVITALAAIPLVWAWFKARMGERMVKLALKAPETTTPAEIREQAKQPDK